MLLLEDAKQYWTIASRMRRNASNPAMPGVACRDMDKLLGETSAPVRQRIIAFTTQHRPKPPKGTPPGPRFA